MHFPEELQPLTAKLSVASTVYNSTTAPTKSDSAVALPHHLDALRDTALELACTFKHMQDIYDAAEAQLTPPVCATLEARLSNKDARRTPKGLL